MKKGALMKKLLSLFAAITLLAAPAYIESAKRFRADYEASLKAPDGWLAVSGLVWLNEGENTIDAAPGKPVFVLHNGKVTLKPDTRVLVPDTQPKPDVIRRGSVTLTLIDRDGHLGIRMRDPESKAVKSFTGTRWFPPSESWIVRAKWTPWPQPHKLAITNILGMTGDEVSPGYAEFTLKGQTLRLTPILDEGQLFFMFKDRTTGKTTYPAGRFLYSPVPDNSGEVTLDFNQAHNPPCAFTEYATCPLPPRENTLALAIEAGEMTYGHH